RHRRLFPLGLSSMLFSPVLRAELPLLWALRFHSPQTFDRLLDLPADRCRTFQSFGRLRNLPCAAELSVRAFLGVLDKFRSIPHNWSAGLRPAQGASA